MTTTLFEDEVETPLIGSGVRWTVGSEPQREWAELIRPAKLAAVRKLISDWMEVIRRHEEAGRDDAAERERSGFEGMPERLEWLERVTSAPWWIDRRKNSALELLKGAPPNPGPSNLRSRSDRNW